MITQLLVKCGMYLGRQQDILGPASDNQDGFWENILFVKLNDRFWPGSAEHGICLRSFPKAGNSNPR